MSRLRTGPMLLFATLLAGCAAGPNYHTPQLPVPEQYAVAAPGGSPGGAAQAEQPQPGAPAQVDLALWWQALGDPELNSLIERAVAGNPDLMIALDQ